MPRGGGGGFRGGGGGFRGGGFRGSSRSSSFRSSSFRSNSRPFGRTGARRTTTSRSSSARRRPTSRSSYRRHRPYRRYGFYGRYYRPYYYRPWYRRRYWYGSYRNHWYSAPGYWCSGTVLVVMLFLIIVPMLGISLMFPFNSWSSGGSGDAVVNYRSTETLYFNEYWYEYESLNEDDTISVNLIQSNQAPISFAISDIPFDSIPRNDLTGSDTGSGDLVQNEYSYISYFLYPGSEISYSFTVTNGSVEFFIVNGDNFNAWYDEEESYDSYAFHNDSVIIPQTIVADITQDYYLVWYNPNLNLTEFDFDIDYTAVDVVDLTSTDRYVIDTYSVSDLDYAVPHAGTWYFFIYFDPLLSPASSTEITFDVTYTTFDESTTTTDSWIDIQGILIFIAVFALVMLVIVRAGRKKQQTMKQQTASAATASTTTTQPASTIAYGKPPQKGSATKPCLYCGTSIKGDSMFCHECGRKQEGRPQGITLTTKPKITKDRQICSFCGTSLPSESAFCASCGSKISR
ncbi:MAG: zinc ribbon domain-containing protein [Promethearchaeota archaeon]